MLTQNSLIRWKGVKRNSMFFAMAIFVWTTSCSVTQRKLETLQISGGYSALKCFSRISSPASSHICYGVGQYVDPFRSHVSRSLFKRLPWFLLQLENSVSLSWVIYYEAFYVFTVCIQFLLHSSNLSKIGVIFNSFVICLFVSWSVQVYPAFLLIYFISAAAILLASLALIVQVSLLYNKTGRASLFYNFILVSLRNFCGRNSLFKIPVIFK